MAKKTKTPPSPPSKEEGNKFDKIIKENLDQLAPALFEKVLKTKLYSMENLPQVRLQTTKEVEPDFARKVCTDKHPDGAILHMEFESKDELRTDPRMLQYFSEEYIKYGLPIEQTLIYLLKGMPKNIKGFIKLHNLDFRYDVICIYDISFREFVYSDKPEEVVWSILANPDGEKEEDIIRLILQQLIQLRGHSSELGKFINQLKVLSMLRNLRPETLKQTKNMLTTEDIIRQLEADEYYVAAREQGLEKGLEKGLKEGREEGILKTQVIAVVNMLRLEFTVEMIAGILNMDKSLVTKIKAQMKKEEAIIVLLKDKKTTIEQIAKKLRVLPVLVETIKNGKY